MKIRLLNSLLALLALVAIVIADGASIVAAEQTIATDTLALNDTVASWDGNPLTVLKILVESTKLLVDINAATGVAKASANLSDTEAFSVAVETQALAVDVQSTLATIVSKKHLFQIEFLQPLTLLNLKLEKAATDAFSKAVVAKVPAALAGAAASLTAPIDQAFDAAIAAFESF